MAVSYDPKVDRFVDGMKGTVVDTIDAITAGEIVSLADSMPADSGAQEASELAALRKEARSNILRALALMHESNEKGVDPIARNETCQQDLSWRSRCTPGRECSYQAR